MSGIPVLLITANVGSIFEEVIYYLILFLLLLLFIYMT